MFLKARCVIRRAGCNPERLTGRSLQPMKAEAVAGAIRYWREQQGEAPLNLAALHEWLVREHDYRREPALGPALLAPHFPVPRLRARRRVETPPGAQAQVDWAALPGRHPGRHPDDLVALHMVLSFSRKPAIVWSPTKDMLAWLGCHTACFTRSGRRAGDGAHRQREDRDLARARARGVRSIPPIDAMRRPCSFHIDACPPRATPMQGESRTAGARSASGDQSQPPAWRDLAELQQWTDARIELLVTRAALPGHRLDGRPEPGPRSGTRLTRVPETLPEPFDLVATRQVGLDGLVSFEGRQYSVPFRLIGQARRGARLRRTGADPEGTAMWWRCIRAAPRPGS